MYAEARAVVANIGFLCFVRAEGAGGWPGHSAAREKCFPCEHGGMHELSIALSMLEQIEEEAARHSGAVLAVQVKIGVLSGVDCDALSFAWEIAREGTDVAGARLEIERVPLLVRCPGCGVTHAPEMQAIFCPRCITPEQDILSGRELELTSLEIES